MNVRYHRMYWLKISFLILLGALEPCACSATNSPNQKQPPSNLDVTVAKPEREAKAEFDAIVDQARTQISHFSIEDRSGGKIPVTRIRWLTKPFQSYPEYCSVSVITLTRPAPECVDRRCQDITNSYTVETQRFVAHVASPGSLSCAGLKYENDFVELKTESAFWALMPLLPSIIRDIADGNIPAHPAASCGDEGACQRERADISALQMSQLCSIDVEGLPIDKSSQAVTLRFGRNRCHRLGASDAVRMLSIFMKGNQPTSYKYSIVQP